MLTAFPPDVFPVLPTHETDWTAVPLAHGPEPASVPLPVQTYWIYVFGAIAADNDVAMGSVAFTFPGIMPSEKFCHAQAVAECMSWTPPFHAMHINTINPRQLPSVDHYNAWISTK